MANDSHGVASELSRELTLFHITMMGLGMMIGAGVFIGIGNTIHHAGPGGVILTFAFNGVVAMLTAMSYAELSSAVPRAGGAYNFARLAFGKGPSFVAGWMEWFASSLAGSLYAVVFAIYILRFFTAMRWLSLSPESLVVWQRLLALAVALFFLYINYRGASETGKVGAFFTLGQTLFLVVIGVVGLVVVSRDPSRLENFKPFMPMGWGKLLVTMGFTYVAFEGYEVIAQAGDEAIDPRRNIPKAMIYSVCIVTFTYVAVAFASVVAVKAGTKGMPPWQWIGSHGEKGFGEAVGELMPYSNYLLTLAVIFASTSALNATIYSATRAAYALGRDRMLPGAMAAISTKRKTPYVALAGTGVIVMVVAGVLPTMHVAASASIMFLFLFLLVNLCVIKIRRNMGDELHYGFLTPFFPFPPLLAIVAQAVLAGHIFHISVTAWYVAIGWIAAGLCVYFVYSRSRAKFAESDIRVFEEELAPEGDEYRVMVPVANPDNALELVLNTYRICKAKDARVELLHMVPVPDAVPLSDADRYMNEGREGIVEAMLYLAPRFPLSSTIRYCRSVARGIVSAVRERKAKLLILGWHGHRESALFSIGSTVDPVIERAPCSVVVMKNCGNRKFHRVLVPLAGGPNGAFALEIASILAEDDGEIVAMTVADGGKPFDLEKFVARQEGGPNMPEGRISTRVIHSDHVREAILEEAGEYDLVVLGATRSSWLAQLARESVPEAVARLREAPVVMVSTPTRLGSWIRRWV